MSKDLTITRFTTEDIRFPTSTALDGSDAMNPDPDYSAAYVVLDTFTGDADGLRRPESAWRMLATVAERLVDLERGTLREGA